MTDKIEKFFNDIKGKDVCFIGAGVTNKEIISMFAKKGANVTLRDKRTQDKMGDICNIYTAQGVKLILGEDYLENMTEEIIFRTPGMYYYNPYLQKARKDGAIVTSEMEVFLDLCPCKVYAVTGSDGKTTTTTVISKLLEAQGKKVYVGGNIGKPLLPLIENIENDACAVVELSSFQLISMKITPDVSVITNIAPNHLDVHENMEEYIEAKKNIFTHQNAFSKTIINGDNKYTKEFFQEIRGISRSFSIKNPQKRGAYLSEDGNIYVADKDGIHKIINKDIIKIPGMHNVENYLAAISAVWGDVSKQTIVSVAESFGGVEHRIEFVREIGGVRWYNDSIATSPTRTIAGLNSFNQKMIIIAGGYDKKIPFLPLAPKIIEKVKILILTGDTAQKIQDTVINFTGYNPNELEIIRVDSLEEAVKVANEKAKKGDVVSLSPACASFDKYPNFEQRGVHFKKLVCQL